MARASLPPGFRFHPTDAELIMYYLRRKIMGKRLRFEVIGELDLYKYSAQDLPEKSQLKSRDLEWYFFCPRDRKYSNGTRTNRATEFGFWKTTGKDKPICVGSKTVGMRKSLVFHEGRPRRGAKTNWVMHEYRLEDKDLVDTGILQDAYVLCKIFQKSGAGPKNGEQRGAPFREEDWEEDVPNDSYESFPLGLGSSVVHADDQNTVAETHTLGNSCREEPAASNVSEEPPDWFEDYDIEDLDSLLALLNDVDDFNQNGTGDREKPEFTTNLENNVEAPPFLDGNDIFNGLEDLSTTAELKTIDNFGSHNLGDKYVLDQTLLGDEVPYMELNDLDTPMDCPVKANCSKHISNENRSTRLELNGIDKFHTLRNPGYNDFDQRLLGDDASFMALSDLELPMKCHVELNDSKNIPLGSSHDLSNGCGTLGSLVDAAHTSDAVLPSYGVSTSHSMLLPMGPDLFSDHLAMVSNDNQFGGSAIHEDAMPIALSNEDPEREQAYSSGALARGEQHNTSLSRLECLLGSIPARPASAAEYQPLSGGKGSKGNSLFAYYGGSSIHVKAEVTVNCRCTEDALLIKMGEVPCPCYGRNLRREIGKEVATCGSGFTFMFLLGVITALVWIFLLAMGAKLGWYAWKLIIS